MENPNLKWMIHFRKPPNGDIPIDILIILYIFGSQARASAGELRNRVRVGLKVDEGWTKKTSKSYLR
jgi:hypothetical protein